MDAFNLGNDLGIDLELAKRLQEEYDREAASSLEDKKNESPKKSGSVNIHQKNTQSPSGLYESGLSPVDPSWELKDPNPDIRELFLQFNVQFFWGRLSGIEVKWSPRMTL